MSINSHVSSQNPSASSEMESLVKQQTHIAPEKPVVVTGASGYIGSWIVYHLLKKGYHVHGTVRDPQKQKSVAHLQKMSRELGGKLTLFQADLLEEGSFHEAMQGCEVVIHTASPFLIGTIKDPMKALVEPALFGTKNVLESVNNTQSVKRVVLTSSVVGIYGDNQDIKKTKEGMFTEQNWNETSRADHQPYNYSKVVAEKAAWDMQKAQADKPNAWDLVVINPGLVMGAALTKNSVSGSIGLLKQFANGVMRSGAPDLHTGMVAVQDVAKAHIKAAFIPAAHGRYILVDKCLSLLEMASVLRSEFGSAYPFPKMKLPKMLVWLVAPMAKQSREMIKKNVGYKVAFDNSRSKEELGINYQPVEEALVAHFQQLIDDGIIKKPK